MKGKRILIHDGRHSPLGPSSAKRWINCPGSVRATADIIEAPSSYADEGTAAHALSEWCRRDGCSAKKYEGAILVVVRGEHKREIPVTPELIDGVDRFVEYVEGLPGIPLYEVEVSYDQWVPRGFGTTDDVRLGETTYNTDFKFGKGVQVYAKRNPQLMLYALGLIHTYGWLIGIKKFVLGVHQPRLDHIDTWEVSAEEILDWASTTVYQAARATKQPHASFKAGPWCSENFCKIRDRCKVRARSIFETVTADFEDLGSAVASSSGEYRAPTLNNDEVAAILHALPNVKKFCADIERRALAEKLAGRAVGEWKLVGGRSSRSFTAAPAVLAPLVDRKVLEFYGEPEPKSVAEIEKMLGKPAFRKLEEYVKKTPGAPTLAPGDDRRPEVTPLELTGFEEINTEDGE